MPPENRSSRAARFSKLRPLVLERAAMTRTPVSPAKVDPSGVIADLNQKWQLDLPLSKPLYSPSKRGGKSKGTQAYEQICHHFYKNRAGLDAALARFAEQAHAICTQWIPKPRAEPGVVPGRGSNPWPGVMSRKFSVEEAEQLLDTLLTLLPPMRSGSEGPAPARASVEPVAQPTKPVKWAQSRISDVFAPKARSPSPRTPQPIDSDRMEVDLAGLDADMKVLEASFRTPAQSESEGEDNLAYQCFEKKTDNVPIHRPSESKKRPLPLSQSDDTGSPRKNPRETDYHQVNTFEPKHDPSTSGLPEVPLARGRGTGNVPSANTSFATTENTSFRTEVTSTSFMDTADESPKPESRVTRAMSSNLALRLADRNDNEMDIDGAAESAAVPAQVPHLVDGVPVDEYLEKPLIPPEMLRESTQLMRNPPSFRIRWEATRVSLVSGVPVRDLLEARPSPPVLENHKVLSEREKRERELSYQKKLWSSWAGVLGRHDQHIPERSPLEAWMKAAEHPDKVSLSGQFTFSNSLDQPLLQFRLKPLKIELSYRLKRKYGSFRFLHIDLPGIGSRELPKHLKDHAEAVREKVKYWLIAFRLHLLGRQWKLFYSKAPQAKPAARKNADFDANEPRLRLYYFAERGLSFPLKESGERVDQLETTSLLPTSVEQMIQWLIDIPNHLDESWLKLWSRIGLGVTPTKPTVVFNMQQIKRTNDAFSHDPNEFEGTTDAVSGNPFVRSLTRDRKKKDLTKSTQSGMVMNDGCARISPQAARQVADRLGMSGQPAPSAYQGRIGGAKGLWFVDPSDEKDEHGNGVWIEVTDSQLKFDWHQNDKLWPDERRRTFEVTAWSTPLSASRLNFQFMPILVNRGVESHILKLKLEADITKRCSLIEAAKESPRALASWNQENAPLLTRRGSDGSIEWQGGQPRSIAEQINWLVGSGFSPKELRHLAQLLYDTIRGYMDRLETRMHIGVGCSTIALCIADPLGVLEEGEVHFAFSTNFEGEVLDHENPNQAVRVWANTMLNNEDVLVARSPAHLPSDIQRVRAVFKSQLANIKDIIVFSAKGRQPLADKLSGGDYDGDRVWVCWDPDFVQNFRNAPVPPATSPETHGMEKDRRTVRDIGENAVEKFVNGGLDFNFQPSLLGPATIDHEKLSYERWLQRGSNVVEDPVLVEHAQMLGLLVDGSKGGITYLESDHTEYKKRKGLSLNPRLPAYKMNPKNNGKNKKQPVPGRYTHPIDEARAACQNVRESVLGDETKKLNEIPSYDPTIQAANSIEEQEAAADSVLKEVRAGVRHGLGNIQKLWRENTHEHKNGRVEQSDGAWSFGTLIQRLRDRLEALGPLGEKDSNMDPLAVEHPVVRRWQRDFKDERTRSSLASSWMQYKASMLFCLSTTSKLPWYVAMGELCAIKALASERPVVMAKDLHEVAKVDTKLARRLDSDEKEQIAALMEVLEDDAPEGWIAEEDFLEAMDSISIGD